MNLHAPFIITARLCAGLQVGDMFISIEYSDKPGCGRRTRYTYHFDLGPQEHTGSDLQSGQGGGTLQRGMEDLLSFLEAAIEYEEHADLFPPWVVAWGREHADEIACLRIEIEETKVPLLTE